MDYQYISIDGGDGYFSRQPCDLCGSTLGGMRYDATARESADSEIVELEICVDCVMDIGGIGG